MKKIIALALLAMIMVGCKDEEGRNYATDERGYVHEVTIIDSCEYFGVLDCGNGNFLTHKGNCRFCTERNKRMIREQVDSILLEIFD